jgi:CII-binding regulator of phage lambda lysogenization HflD
MKERITAETIADSARRQEELRLLLKEMARICLEEEDEQISVFASQLRELYIPSFRHRYSEFFPMLVEIDEEESELGLDFLSTNIRKVRKYVERKCAAGDTTYDSLYKPMMKLSDHLSLEIARYSHFISQNRQIMDLTDKHQDLQAQLAETTERLHEATAKLDQANARFSQTEIKLTDAETKLANAETKLTDAETKLQAIKTNIKTANENIDDTEKKISSIHIDIIAVLSIFASIVLTFSGSMTVLGSALTGMQEVHALKATFFVLLCGFVLGNIIFLLMYLVGKLTSRNIYARCKTENCTCGEGGAPECRGLKRIRKRLPYIYWLNLILIVLMTVVVVVWYLDNHYHFIH